MPACRSGRQLAPHLATMDPKLPGPTLAWFESGYGAFAFTSLGKFSPLARVLRCFILKKSLPLRGTFHLNFTRDQAEMALSF
jgi:hypothetical protein